MAAHPLHPSTHRKEFSSLPPTGRAELRKLIDAYIAGECPVREHRDAGRDMTLMIHDMGFLAWHNVFIGKLEHWLVINGAAQYVPLPYWYPATPIPVELDRGNSSPNLALPAGLMPGPIAMIADYTALNNEVVPYHNAVHNSSGGEMPNAETSPSDPIFWAFHAFLIAVYEHWRYH